MMAGTEPNGRAIFDPTKVADLAMNLVNKVGLPLVLLGIIGYYAVPAHLAFVNTAREHVVAQTAIIQAMKKANEQAIERQDAATEHVDALVDAIGSGDLKQIEQLSTVEKKIDGAAEKLDVIETSVNSIKAHVEKTP